MEVTTKFITDSEAGKRLLTDAGYSTEHAIDAVAMLGELCVLSTIVETMTENYERGELLPPRFEVDLDVPPMQLYRGKNIDILEYMVSRNILVPRRGNTYRVMLSSMMNRIFSLTGNDDKESIRKKIKNIRQTEAYLNFLDEVEWELVQTVHENVDAKYLDTDELETMLTPDNLLESFRQAQQAQKKLREVESDKELAKYRTQFREAIESLAENIEKEASRQRKIMVETAIYPRSFIGRRDEPLVRSSWALKPDFKNHPLIIKFQKVIKNNHDTLSELADLYEDYIREVVDGLDSVHRDETDSEMEKHWEKIDTHAKALKVQALMIEKSVSSMDSLFTEH
ncbi:MAG: hypothetical protein GF411_03910 [Candidatus Lokiarchaeota archaeon]|nr:hypothetical protein [Candidatus Lokiarchaeota archaeon]